MTTAERKELESIEENILAAEEATGSLEAQLHDPDFQRENINEIAGLMEELTRRKANVAGLYSRWEELEALVSN